MKQYQDLIFDVGMHVGQDTEFYLKKGFRVIAIEANPVLVEEATVRFSDAIRCGALRILHLGIAESEGVLPFYVNHQYSEWSSFIPEVGSRMGAFHVIEVPCVGMESIFSDYGMPYYLKVDIEGLDYLVIEALKAVDSKPKYVSVENGNNGLADLLAELGYRSFKFVNQAQLAGLTLTAPAQEGKFVAHEFAHGSSGPFGEEAPGGWVDHQSVCAQIDQHWRTPGLDAAVHGWYDLHARHGL